MSYRLKKWFVVGASLIGISDVILGIVGLVEALDGQPSGNQILHLAVAIAFVTLAVVLVVVFASRSKQRS